MQKKLKIKMLEVAAKLGGILYTLACRKQ